MVALLRTIKKKKVILKKPKKKKNIFIINKLQSIIIACLTYLL